MRDDSVLLTILQENPNDARAFEEILQKYERLIYFVARRYFPIAEDAMDASQEAAIKIYNGLPRATVAEGGTLKAWVCTVTARVCLDALRKKRPIVVELTEDAPVAHLPSAEDAVAANERTREILQAVHELPNDHRMVVILRDMQGMAYDEIAGALKISVGTVKSRLSRAREKLRRVLR